MFYPNEKMSSIPITHYLCHHYAETMDAGPRDKRRKIQITFPESRLLAITAIPHHLRYTPW